MAITLPIVSEFVDKGVQSAEAAFKNFKNKVGQADGAMGKFKAGGEAAFDAIKANAATMALSAGASFAAFAAYGIKAFRNLALEAGKFSAATGLPIEDASRLMEVAGDLGVDVDTVERAIGKLLRTIKADPGVVKALGEEAILTEGGFVDANEAFLRAVDYLGQIKDPAEKAREGVRLFGKGWQQVAPLIEEGADRIRERLQAVSEQKIISREEFQRAKDFRDSLDDLKDKGEDLAIALGETLVPILSNLFELLGKVFKVVDNVVGAVGDFGDKVADLTGAGGIKDATEKIRDLEAVGRLLGETVQTKIVANLDELAEQTLPDVTYEWDSFLGQLTRQDAFDEAKRQVDELNEAIVAAFNGEEINAEQIDKAVRDAQRAIGDLVATMLAAKEITGAEANAILFNVKAGQLEYATKLLQNPALMQDQANMALAPGQTYIPGIGTFGTNSTISGQSATNVTINMPAGSSGDDVVRAMQRWSRDNGAVPLPTTTTIQR